jgi:hypothetical protein
MFAHIACLDIGQGQDFQLARLAPLGKSQADTLKRQLLHVNYATKAITKQTQARPAATRVKFRNSIMFKVPCLRAPAPGVSLDTTVADSVRIIVTVVVLRLV